MHAFIVIKQMLLFRVCLFFRYFIGDLVELYIVKDKTLYVLKIGKRNNRVIELYWMSVVNAEAKINKMDE